MRQVHEMLKKQRNKTEEHLERLEEKVNPTIPKKIPYYEHLQELLQVPSQRDCDSRRTFVAILTSFLERMSACLAEFLSKPIDTSIEIASSGGSGVDETGAG